MKMNFNAINRKSTTNRRVRGSHIGKKLIKLALLVQLPVTTLHAKIGSPRASNLAQNMRNGQTRSHRSSYTNPFVQHSPT